MMFVTLSALELVTAVLCFVVIGTQPLAGLCNCFGTAAPETFKIARLDQYFWNNEKMVCLRSFSSFVGRPGNRPWPIVVH